MQREVERLKLESADLKSRLKREEESKRQWQDIARQKEQHIIELQDQAQTTANELFEERKKLIDIIPTSPQASKSMSVSGMKQSALKRQNLSTEYIPPV